MLSAKAAQKTYNECLAALDLTQVGAADFLDVDQRTSRRWASGERPIPTMAIMLFNLMIDRGVTPEEAYTLTHGKAPDEPFRGDRRKRAE